MGDHYFIYIIHEVIILGISVKNRGLKIEMNLLESVICLAKNWKNIYYHGNRIVVIGRIGKIGL